MNNKLWEKQYFDCTSVWGINGRNGYFTFEYLCDFAILFCIFQCLLGPLGGAT